MNTQQAELRQRLEQFSLDSVDASFPFSSRLARENGWSIEYTQRVICEYKRFAFLAVAAGHPVSPAEAVDEAWHLHLIYTENYWKKFCGEVLQKPLHHQPTKGGADEQEKFHDWYAQTLASYRKFFGEPPCDIWPTPLEKAAAKNHFVRVDKRRHWVLPKPRLQPAVFTTALLLVVAGLATGCNETLFRQLAHPLDMKGTDFLGFYGAAFAVCVGAAAWLRWKWRAPASLSTEDFSTMDSYAMAYLNGGKILAVNSALTSLIHQKALQAKAKEQKLMMAGDLPRSAHPLETALYNSVNQPGGEKIAAVREAAKPVVTAMLEQLKTRGLIVNDADASRARWLPLAVALLAPLFGLAKIYVGLSRGKPVGFLMVACFVSVVVSLIAFARRPHRSRRGDQVLKQLRERHARLKKDAEFFQPGFSSAEMAAMVGLFGMSALEGTAMADLKKTLQPPGASSSGCGASSCGSSCGGGGGGCGGCGGD